MARRIAGLLIGLLACWTANLVSVEDVIDGDTFRAELAIWPRILVTETVRVLGVDTPERREGEPAERATTFTRDWLREGLILVTACRYDAFGRVLGRVEKLPGRATLDAALIGAGHGVPFPAPRRKD